MADSLESWPGILAWPDRKYYSEEHENPAVRTEMEGGYVASRPRHRRAPLRRTWTFGYTDLSNSSKKALEGFYNAQKGGSKVFQWLNVYEYQNAVYEYLQANPNASLADAYILSLIHI